MSPELSSRDGPSSHVLEADIASFSALLPMLQKQVKDTVEVVRKIRDKFPQDSLKTSEVLYAKQIRD